MRRGIENVEVACGTPILMQGYKLEDIAPGIDEVMVRQPLGVVAVITPFNFPAMIPLWFLPYAIATGNTVLVKPSEKVPLTLQRIVELIHEAGVPPGVVNLVHGAKPTVERDSGSRRRFAPSASSGSTAVARYIYARAAASGKRAQCQGGAKNYAVVMPDADMDGASQIIADGAFGCAGQRCLAVSVVVTVGDARRSFQQTIGDIAAGLRVGPGLDPGVQMGPVITAASKQRIEQLIGRSVKDGATPIVNGRGARIPSYEAGNFIRPTLLDGLPPNSELIDTEIFGPVLTMVHAADIDDAIALVSIAGTEIRLRSSRPAAPPPASSGTKCRPATSGSISESRLRWPTSRSADGRTASSVPCMPRAATRSSSTPTKKFASNAGRKTGRGNSGVPTICA